MKKAYPIILSVGLIFALVGVSAELAFAQEEVTVPFSDPSRPGTVRADILMGGITVEGYDGTEVVIRAISDGRQSRTERNPDRAEGLRRIVNTSTGLSVEERNNVMTIETSVLSRIINLTIRVPFNTSLNLDTVSGGDIEVDNVRGEVEVNNTNGGVRLTNISGSVVAHALNGEVTVTLTEVDGDSPMSFSSLNGEIDVTLPSDVRVTVKMKTDNGEIYSDFEIELQSPTPANVVNNARGNRNRIRIDQTITGNINGGGPEIQLTTFNGNIYIRKGP